jgi:D-alanyl-lipoteichoic acid acyltransferase DltB (MBOAT superfamily)
MSLTSFDFIIFFPIVAGLYYVLPHRHRWWFLLAASAMFYMAFIPAYIAVLFLVVAIGYVAAILIERAQGRARKVWLAAGIAATCLILLAFKYLGFFAGCLIDAARVLHWNYPVPVLNIILPLGLSFQTFQSMSYMIEVYRRKQDLEKHFGYYALFVIFFPQLSAGPIERPQNMLHQFREEHVFSYAQVTGGIKLMVWGVFKKVVVADRLAILVSAVYGNPRGYTGLPLILATLFFSFQIYCDFSGYSDIAIGAAQVLGFRLRDNFNRPYQAASIPEFWHRWHISLSTWFRDYLYVPLGGNRVSQPRWHFNLFITFLLSGLWHGANSTFLAWGTLHCGYYFFHTWTSRIRERLVALSRLYRRPVLHQTLQAGTTFCLVSFAWIFFVSKSMDDAFYVVSHLFVRPQNSSQVAYMKNLFLTNALGIDPVQFVLALLSVLFVLLFYLFEKHEGMRALFAGRPPLLRWSLYYALIMAVLLFGVFDNPKPFLYFQF